MLYSKKADLEDVAQVSQTEITLNESNFGMAYRDFDLPSGWSKANNVVGSINNNVTVEESEEITFNDKKSVKVTSISPCGGIQQPLNKNAPLSWMVYPTKGRAALHLAKKDGTSAFFTTNKLLQPNFTVRTRNEPSTAIRCVHALRIDYGNLIELFSASSNSESTNKGAVYMKRNGGNPTLFMHEEGYKIWPWPGVIDLSSKYLWVSMRLNAEGEMALHATDISRDFNTTSNDRLLYRKKGYNLQAYNMIKLPNGSYLIPIVYTLTSQVQQGPWMLDILYTDDNFATVKCLNSPKTFTGRGLMEPHPVLLSSGKVAILCRTNQGYLAKAIYDPKSNTLGSAILTDVAQVESGSYARNLNNGDILLSWVSAINSRKFVVMAVSSDDMESWKSFHVLASSESLGDSMTYSNPYVHQPFLFQDGPNLVAYVERVVSPTITSLYKCVSNNFNIDNVSKSKNSWQNLACNHLPANTSSLQLLNVINRDSEVHYTIGDGIDMEC